MSLCVMIIEQSRHISDYINVERDRKDEELVVGENKKKKKRKMAELSEEGQTSRRAKLAAKRAKKRLIKKQKIAEKRELERNSSNLHIPSDTCNATHLYLNGESSKTNDEVNLKQRPLIDMNKVSGLPMLCNIGIKAPYLEQMELTSKECSALKGKGKDKAKNSVVSDQGTEFEVHSQMPKLWQNPKNIVISLNNGPATKDDLITVQKTFIDAAFKQGPCSKDSDRPVLIRGVILKSGKVVVTVWDEITQVFVLNALNGGPYQSAVEDGVLRMIFNISPAWGDVDHEKFMQVLYSHNPGLPADSLTFVSWIRRTRGGWTVFVDVDRSGIDFLRRQDSKLYAVLESVHLKPVQK